VITQAVMVYRILTVGR